MSEKIVIKEEVVLIDALMDSREQLLDYMSKLLEKEGYVKNTFGNAILKRENQFSTGLPTEELGVAIPHTDAIHVEKSVISVATLREPIEFQEMGNPDGKVSVKIVFMLAVKNGNSQVKLLTNLMDIVQNKELLREIYKSDQKQIVKLMNEYLIEKEAI